MKRRDGGGIAKIKSRRKKALHSMLQGIAKARGCSSIRTQSCCLVPQAKVKQPGARYLPLHCTPSRRRSRLTLIKEAVGHELSEQWACSFIPLNIVLAIK